MTTYDSLVSKLTNRRNDVCVDVVFGTLLGQSLSEANHCKLSSWETLARIHYQLGIAILPE
jgi:hypothetical protein